MLNGTSVALGANLRKAHPLLWRDDETQSYGRGWLTRSWGSKFGIAFLRRTEVNCYLSRSLLLWCCIIPSCFVCGGFNYSVYISFPTYYTCKESNLWGVHGELSGPPDYSYRLPQSNQSMDHNCSPGRFNYTLINFCGCIRGLDDLKHCWISCASKEISY